MGYWNQTEEGHSLQPESTGLVWGDRPADIFDGAINEAVEAFQRDLGRRPSATELLAGFKFSLSNYAEG